MTTPSGVISLNDVNIELGRSGTTTISIGEAAVRSLAGVASGAISLDNLRGKSNRVSLSYVFSSNTANASLNLSAIGGYISGKSDITITVNSGVYLYATSTGSYGLNITGGTTGDTLTIVNNGYIMGQGGQGGWYPNNPNTAGGSALNLGFGMSSCTINNTNGSAYIGGGGGGGGYAVSGSNTGAGGGGAGGGAGGYGTSGGAIGASGNNGAGTGQVGYGGGGGRIFPGTGGAGANGTGAMGGYGGGAGGGGGSYAFKQTAFGGNGGSANSAGSNGSSGYNGGGGGGGWGASGGSGLVGTYSVGAAGGKAVNTNGKSVTWTSGNTTRVYGSVS